SFTGLRLGFAALKAIELFGGRKDSDQDAPDQEAPRSCIPLYAINTLDAYAWPFLDFDGIILPVIDAHKDKFYAKAFLNKKEILNCDDWDLRALEEKLLSAANENSLQAQKPAAGKILVCGQEAKTFIDACKENGLFGQNNLLAAQGRLTSLESLFALAEQKIASGQPPLADYDGPQYFRASEAEQNLPSA
ncbi:MAG: hypothetical protein J5700_00175, partial [Treponema sp.]|nr:hypothetical protein [Treponema sp.]